MPTSNRQTSPVGYLILQKLPRVKNRNSAYFIDELTTGAKLFGSIFSPLQIFTYSPHYISRLK